MKLDLILENVRNKYNFALLEESETLGEKEVLKGKILVNEATMNIRKYLIEEGIMDSVKSGLQNSWQAIANNKGKIAAGLGGAALAGAAGYDHFANEDKGLHAIQGAASDAGKSISNAYDSAKSGVYGAIGKMRESFNPQSNVNNAGDYTTTKGVDGTFSGEKVEPTQAMLDMRRNNTMEEILNKKLPDVNAADNAKAAAYEESMKNHMANINAQNANPTQGHSFTNQEAINSVVPTQGDGATAEYNKLVQKQMNISKAQAAYDGTPSSAQHLAKATGA